MAENLQHQELHAYATNTSGKGSPQQLQSPDSDQRSVTIPIIAKTGGQSAIRKSTGPRTAQGKERSKLNAFKHGLFSKAVLLRGESGGEYLSLLDGLLEDLQPQGKLETTLVENLAVLLWRKRRLFQAESAEISEKIDFMKYDSILNKYVEAWDHSRDAITTGGLLKYSNNPIVVREAIEILGMLRELITKLGFSQDSRLLKKLYGQDQDGGSPHGLRLMYEALAVKVRFCAKSDYKSVESNNRELMIELIDHEMKRLTKLEKSLKDADHMKSQYKLSASLIPGQEASDRLLRYETHFTREIDRVLNRLERLQRLRMGQPLPPRVDININP
jgi:hypothetical protein